MNECFVIRRRDDARMRRLSERVARIVRCEPTSAQTWLSRVKTPMLEYHLFIACVNDEPFFSFIYENTPTNADFFEA